MLEYGLLLLIESWDTLIENVASPGLLLLSTLFISHSSKEVEPILNYLERMDRPNRSSLVCLLSAVKPMAKIGRIGDLQLDIYTKNLKNNDWKRSIHHGLWSFSSHSPVTCLRLAVPHRLGNIESDRLHKLIHPEEDVNSLC